MVQAAAALQRLEPSRLYCASKLPRCNGVRTRRSSKARDDAMRAASTQLLRARAVECVLCSGGRGGRICVCALVQRGVASCRRITPSICGLARPHPSKAVANGALDPGGPFSANRQRRHRRVSLRLRPRVTELNTNRRNYFYVTYLDAALMGELQCRLQMKMGEGK